LKRVVGIGVVFLKVRKAKKLTDWYQKLLGITTEEGAVTLTFIWMAIRMVTIRLQRTPTM